MFVPSPRSWRNRDPLRISFLGFNPLCDGYDGRGKIDRGADRTFASLQVINALRFVRRYFDSDGDGRLTADDQPPFDLRITGYSFGGWSALQLAHTLGKSPASFRIRIGLIDPVNTFRPRRRLQMAWWRWKLPRKLTMPMIALQREAAYATRPPQVVWAENYFQTKGLIARFNGSGFRLPMRARWFASQPIEGFTNYDLSAEVSAEAGHIDICEKYAAVAARRTFEESAEMPGMPPSPPVSAALPLS